MEINTKWKTTYSCEREILGHFFVYATIFLLAITMSLHKHLKVYFAVSTALCHLWSTLVSGCLVQFVPSLLLEADVLSVEGAVHRLLFKKQTLSTNRQKWERHTAYDWEITAFQVSDTDDTTHWELMTQRTHHDEGFFCGSAQVLQSKRTRFPQLTAKQRRLNSRTCRK